MKRSYPQSFGEWSNIGHVEEHAFGHPDILGGKNHNCPHFVAWRNDGSPPVEFPYKSGTI